MINRSIIFAFAISSVTLALWSARIPGRTVVAVVGGYVALNFLWVAVRWIAPLELERYFDRNGKLAFDVIRERAQGADFDDFTATLRKRIEDTNAVNEPNKAPEPTSGTVTPHADACVAPVPPVAHL